VGFLNRLFGREKETRAAKPVKEGEAHYVRCWVEKIAPTKTPGVFPLAVIAQALPTGLMIRFPEKMVNHGIDILGVTTGLDRVLQIGLYHTLSFDGNYDPFVMSYGDMEEIVGALYVREGNRWRLKCKVTQDFPGGVPRDHSFRIEITYRNVKKGTKLLLMIVADRPKGREDPNQTLDLFNEILANKIG